MDKKAYKIRKLAKRYGNVFYFLQDMNEVSNFIDGSIYGCPQTEYDKPPYIPGNTNFLHSGNFVSPLQGRETYHFSPGFRLSVINRVRSLKLYSRNFMQISISMR